MSDVFVVGALHLDVVVEAPRLPMLDETLMGTSVAYRFGGKGGNQALAAARMGASVAMAGQVGCDDFANVILNSLDRAGVDRTQVAQVPGATGMSVAIVVEGGDYGAVVVSGVNQANAAKPFDSKGAKVILIQNEIPEAVNLGVARDNPDALLVMNAAPARATSPDLLNAVDVLVVNRVEARQILAVEETELDLKHAARALCALGPGAVVLTLGKAGVVVCQNGVEEMILPPMVSRGSTHGAGDAFVGTLAAELARGSDLLAGVRFAALSAAYFVETPPDDRERIRRRDVEGWLSGS